MKYLLLILTTLLIISSVSAVETLGTFKQDKCITLFQSGEGFIQCNITSVQSPDMEVSLSISEMTKTGTEYNKTFCNTTLVGQYITNGVCINGTESVVWAYDFKITKTGEELSTSQGMLYVVGLIIMIFFFILFLYGGFKIPFKNTRSNQGKVITVNDLKYLKIFLLFLSYISLMFIFGITKSIASNFLRLPGIEKFFTYLFWILFSFMWPLMILSLILTIVFFLQDLKFKESILRGAPMS